MKKTNQLQSAFTIRSLAATLLALLVTGLIIQFTGVTDRWGANLGSEPLPVPGMMAFIPVLLVVAAVFVATRFRLLTRAEMVFVLFATLMAAPLMNSGFWRKFLSVSEAIPRNTDFAKYDALKSKLWVHGDNLIKAALEEPGRQDVYTGGDGTTNWREAEIDEGQRETIPVLVNTSPDQVSWVRIKVPLLKDGEPYFIPGGQYMVTALARAFNLGAETRYFCRIYYDDHDAFDEELFTSRSSETKTYLHKTGFVRVGMYGFTAPTYVDNHIIVEFGLKGKGGLELADAQLIDVSAIEGAYAGRRIITESEAQDLTPFERRLVIVRPDNLFSIAGIKFLATGFFPARLWARPVMAWGGFIVLLLAAIFAIAVIMRRQWVQNERYPLPLAQVPLALLGNDDTDRRALPAIFRNPFMWLGFGVALFWTLMQLAHAFNSNVPNMQISFPLKPYLADPAWGKSWNNVNFTVYALFLGLGLFVELNVLMSLVLGFLLFRMQYWFGEANGLAALSGFPFEREQLFGSYTAYAVLVLIFTRKYLWNVLKMAVKGVRQPDEPLSYRSSFILLGCCLAGVVFWAYWVGLPAGSIMVFFLYLLSIGFVSVKLRAECGAPQAFSIGTILVLVPLLGNMEFFPPEVVLFIGLFAGFAGYLMVLFNVPGIQLELMEVARRCKVKPRHVGWASLVGVLGGIMIGGWVYLTSLYSVGAEEFPMRSAHFRFHGGAFKEYNAGIVKATERYLAKQDDAAAVETADASKGIPPKNWAMIIAGAITFALTGLRQLFAGFWFHPVGFILGSTGMIANAWGSFLLALGIRWGVLRLGGAATVREKLLPAATGIVLASITAYLIATFVNGYIYFFNQGGQGWAGQFF